MPAGARTPTSREAIDELCKQVPPNAGTVDMQPTDGIIVWLEADDGQ